MIIPTIYQALAYLNKFNRRILAKKVFIGIFSLIFIFEFAFPGNEKQAMADTVTNTINNAVQSVTDSLDSEKEAYPNTFPQSEARPRKVMTIPVSAYNSLVGQTDSTPCIAARGYNLCEANEENVIAANFLPMGAKVKMPDLFGDREFTVVDRMNPRYYYRADIWMRNYKDAKAFGVKRTKIEIY